MKKVADKRTHLFLDYANLSLADEPEHLYEVVNNIYGGMGDLGFDNDIVDAIISFVKGKKDSIEDKPYPTHGDQFFRIENFIELMERKLWFQIPNFRKIIDKFLEKNESVTIFEMNNFWAIYTLAQSTIYGGIECNQFCDRQILESRKEILNKEIAAYGQKPKCYVCDQLHFRNILDEIIEGKDYKSIDALGNFLRLCVECIRLTAVNLAEDTLVLNNIDIDSSFEVGFPLATEAIYHPFPDFINPFRKRIIAQNALSLWHFLKTGDRRKLKKCFRCGKYFVSKRAIQKQKYCEMCSAKNKMSKEELRLYMRNYRKKEREKKRRIEEIRREPQIQKLMKNLNISRAEAIKTMEDDKKA